MSYLDFVLALTALHGFFKSKYGLGNRLLWYMALPRIEVTTFKFDVMLKNMMQRVHPDQSEKAQCAPMDVGIYKRRMQRLATDNEAYRLCVKENPTVEDLETLSYMDGSWAWLFPIKFMLMNYPEMAVRYRGLLPFGSAVIRYCNALDEKPNIIPTTPSYADHVWLRDLSLREATYRNVSPLYINNEMFVLGQYMTKAHSAVIAATKSTINTSQALLNMDGETSDVVSG